MVCETIDFVYLHMCLSIIRFVAKCGVSLEDLGKPDFITKIGNTVQTSGKLVSSHMQPKWSFVCLFTHSLTLWSGVLLEKLTGSQLVKKCPTFYGNWRFITTKYNLFRLTHLYPLWSIHSATCFGPNWAIIRPYICTGLFYYNTFWDPKLSYKMLL